MAFGDYDFTLSANGSDTKEVTGSVVRVRSCTGTLRISIDGGPGANFGSGQGFRMPAGKTFRTLTIRDVSGSTNTGTVFIGDASYEDQTFSGAVSVTNLPAKQGSYTQTKPAVTNLSSQLVAAKVGRRYLLVQNNDATANVYVNLTGAAATVAGGIRLVPGGVLELAAFPPTDAVTAIADQPTADVRVLEG
jgi:hypothetical protein